MKKNYLYVLLLPHMDEEYNLSYKIKFGFSENFDSRLKNGYESYYGKESVKVLHIYEGDFSMDDEMAIKQYLKDYCLFGSEWFKCCSKVLEFFNIYDTSDKLKQKILEIPVKGAGKIHHIVNPRFIKYVRENVFKVQEDNTINLIDMEINLEEILKNYTLDNQVKYICSTYGLNSEDLIEYSNFHIDSSILALITKFNRLSDTVTKLRFIVNLKDKNLKNNELRQFFSFIPSKYSDYYDILGFDGIKACKCQESYIKRKIEEINGNNMVEKEIKEEIYRLFKVGNRYTKVDIKITLKSLYDRLGYQKTAKASDLGEYFNLKKIYTSDKKNGFEILSKK